MNIRISPESGVPIYQQIVNQVKYLVASGRLAAGDEMPAIRALAEQLIINPNTVARAYRELEIAGIVASRIGAGTTITDTGSRLARKERVRILTEHVDALLATSSQLNFVTEEVIEVIRRREREMKSGV